MKFKNYVVPGLALVSLLTYLVILFVSRDLYVYVDEPDWKMTQTRLLLDDFKLIYLFPFCTASFVQPVPWTWIPTRLIESLIFQDLTHIQKLRYLGIFGFLAWSLIASATLLSPLKEKLNFVTRQALFWSILSVGLLPLVLNYSRPEGLVLLYLSIILFLWQYREQRPQWKRSLRTEILYGVAIGYFCLAALSVHPKAMYFIPVMLVVLYRSLHRKAIQFAAMALVLFSGLETLHIWNARLSCPEAPKVDSFLKSLSINPSNAIKNPSQFKEKALGNLQASPSYWTYIHFANKTYQNQWLPQPPFEARPLDQFLDWWASAIVILGAIVFCLLWGRKLWHDRRVSVQSGFELLVCFSLLGFVACDFLLQNFKNFYEIGILMPVLTIAFFVGLRSVLPEIPKVVLFSLTVLLLVMGILNSSAILSRYFAGWQSGWRAVGQGDYVSAEKIKEVAAKCGLTPESSSHLVLDSQSYPTFSMSHFPVIKSYLFGYYGFETDYHLAIEKLGLTHFIGACYDMPKEYTSRATFVEGGYCCVDLRQPLGK